jgi:hypothetical protein
MSSFLLLESGDKALLESGDDLVLEDHVAAYSITPATETDTAVSFSAGDALLLESGEALLLESGSRILLEADAFAVTSTAATETDSAEALSISKEVFLPIVKQGDTAQELTFPFPVYYDITPAETFTEALQLRTTTGTTGRLIVHKAPDFGAPIEADEALVLSIGHVIARTITPATEADAAVDTTPDTGPKIRISITPVREVG